MVNVNILLGLATTFVSNKPTFNKFSVTAMLMMMMSMMTMMMMMMMMMMMIIIIISCLATRWRHLHWLQIAHLVKLQSEHTEACEPSETRGPNYWNNDRNTSDNSGSDPEWLLWHGVEAKNSEEDKNMMRENI